MITTLSWIAVISIIVAVFALILNFALDKEIFTVIMALSFITFITAAFLIDNKIEKADSFYTITGFEEIYKGKKGVYYIKTNDHFYEIASSDIGVGDSNLLIKKSKPKVSKTEYIIIVKDMDEIKDYNQY